MSAVNLWLTALLVHVLGVCLAYRFPFEVNVGSQESLIQLLNRTEVVAKRGLWQIEVSLHHLPKRVHLKRKERVMNQRHDKGYIVLLLS